MAQQKGIGTQLNELVKFGDRIDPNQAIAAIQCALLKGTAGNARQAAQLAQTHGFQQMIPDLQRSFNRFIGNEKSADSDCQTKLAIIEALRGLESRDDTPYRAAMCCYVPNRSTGKQTDKAAKLRIEAAHAHAEFGSQQEIEELSALLADPVSEVRYAAVRCLAALAGSLSCPFLRLKALIGDESNPNITAACFEELLSCDTSKYIPFVSEFLDSPDAQVRAHAAISLGQSQSPVALDILIGKWKLCSDAEFSRDLLLAIAIIRIEKATGFLISLLRESGETAKAALESLSYCHAQGTRERIEQTIAELDDQDLQRQFNSIF